MEKLKELIKRWSHDGMHWPFVHDPVSEKPSVTLMFFYIAFAITALAVSASSIMMIVKGDYLSATFAPIMIWTMGFVFYRLRKLDSFKIDLDDKSISLDGSDEEKKE